MKQPVRYFSIGLFTASFIIFIIFLFNNTSNNQKDFSVDEMISSIETNGYRVITEEEYITYTIKKDQAQAEAQEKNKKSKENKKEEDKSKPTSKDKNTESDKPNEDEDEKNEVKKYTVKIKSGMVPQEVAKLLEENHIIDDAASFSKFLEDNGYSPYVQIDSFKVTSDMSRKEIAEIITKNRRP